MFLVPPSIASAQSDDAEAAFERKDAAALTRMANAGDPLAQYNLGLMYANGTGVTQDYVQAHKWYNLSAASGDAEPKTNRDELAAKMTSAQIAEAQRLASAWVKK